MNDIKELLTRAAEDAGRPTVTTDAVYVGVAKARWRRAMALSGAVAVVVAVGVVATVIGLPPVGGDRGPSVAALPPSRFGVGGAEQAEKLRKLLPGEIVRVEKVMHAPMRVNPEAEARPNRPPVRSVGPLDGQFLITEKIEGKNKFRGLSITVMDRAAITEDTGGKGLPENFCTAHGDRPLPHCAREELPNGQVLTTWRGTGALQMSKTPWTYNWHGRLTLPDGGLLLFAEGLWAQDIKIMGIVRADHPPRPRFSRHARPMTDEEMERFLTEQRHTARSDSPDDFVPLNQKVFRELMRHPELVPRK